MPGSFGRRAMQAGQRWHCAGFEHSSYSFSQRLLAILIASPAWYKEQIAVCKDCAYWYHVAWGADHRQQMLNSVLG